MAQQAQTIQGSVAQSNDGGIKLEGEERWFNYGQRYKGGKHFAQGQQVEIKYVDWQPTDGGDVRFYINSAQVLNTASASAAPKNGGFSQPNPSRELLIMRESVLKTAVEFLSLIYRQATPPPHPPNESELLFLADSLEAWCLGEGRPSRGEEAPVPDEPPPEDLPG